MYPKKQSFFVLGLSRSGYASAQYLLKEGATVYAYDDVDVGSVSQNKQSLVSQGAIVIAKEDVTTMPEICDALILSPGIPIDHPVAVAFRRRKKGVMGETELAVRKISEPFVAVTGTNGKTTTVSMIAESLRAGGVTAYACGNIGSPMIGLVGEKQPFVGVAEISSFQLETLNSFRPHIAVVLNITQDHLNRHYNMENYIFLKAKLLKNLTETEYAVLNYDDTTVRAFAEKTKAKVVYFSLKEEVDGAYCIEDDLYFNGKKILSIKQMSLSGSHNVQNALACICVSKLLGMPDEKIAQSLESFKGVKHHIEEVCVVEGVCYLDDSKATNVDAAIKAVKCMQQETVLLLGGKDKKQDYDELFSAIMQSKVVHTVLYGENRFRLIESAIKKGWSAITLCTRFEDAVYLARRQAVCGQAVLLSPACASFDEFTDYEERGDRFVSIVEEFKSQLPAAVATSVNEKPASENGLATADDTHSEEE